MCIIIDTNCMASVFKSSSKKHEDFKPVLDWIRDGKGKMVIGGTDYKNEIKDYIGYITELSRVNKTQPISDLEVDEEFENLKDIIDHKDYDDPHIMALLKVSKCKLICSLDERAYKYFKNKELLCCDHTPKIYNKSRNKESLLIDKNIASVCLPCNKLNKKDRSKVRI